VEQSSTTDVLYLEFTLGVPQTSKIIAFVSIAALTVAVIISPEPAKAENGQIAAGVLGGLAVGAIVGSQVGRDGYRDDGYRGDGYYRSSGYRSRDCYVQRREFEDSYGRLRVRNVRVCE
jgi:hypothetical protein